MHILAPTPVTSLPRDQQARTARLMAEAALIFLQALSAEQRAKATAPVDSEERLNWDYRPHARSGLSFKDLDPGQQKLAHALIANGLSRQGHTKAMAIMSLEPILRVLTGRDRYDPDFYYLTIFGTPGEPAWGWRLEGHHVSLNFLVAGGHLAVTPNFFGANPARVLEGPRAGLRVLAAEEDLARRLLKSLDEQQFPQALLADEAPADIITSNERLVRPDTPQGLTYAQMTPEQQKSFQDLVQEYTGRMPPGVAAARLERLEREGWAYLHFAWAGPANPGQPHYYRLHGPSFLVEYDNTQNNANHIHTVWRDLQGDWGQDLLEQHYAQSH
jgi:hypothetical protein